jgi:hypothetical protein
LEGQEALGSLFKKPVLEHRNRFANSIAYFSGRSSL